MYETIPYPVVTLDSVADVLDHFRAPINSEARSFRLGVVPYYGANGQQGWIDKHLTNEPLILLAEDGGNFDEYATRPIAYKIDGPAWVNNHAHILRAKQGNSQSFIYWSIAHKDIRRFIAGGTRTKLTQGELRRIEIGAPKLEEQTLIAKILDTLDTTIRQTEALIEKLKQVKQGLLHDLLTRGIDANGELRPPQSEAPELYKESALGWIPRGWNVSSLKEILAPVDPAMRSGPFGSALLNDELVSSGYPLLGIDNVQVEHFLAEFSRFVTEKKFNELARYAVRPHDLMITIMGTVGRCCTVPKDIGNALSSKHTWTLTLDQTKYLPTLAMLQINYAPWVLKQFAEDEQGGIMSAIRSDTLRKLILPTPPIEEQHEIELRLNSITNRIEAESVSLAKAKLEKSGLMDDLLTGRVRVTPLLESAAA